MAALLKRRSIEDIRKGELIEAAHRVFLQQGLDGLTTAAICQEAGMSPGILAYYFNGKDEVLFAMVRHNNRILLEDIVARLRRAKSPWERIMAVVEGNFPESAYTPNTARAWLSVCSAAGQKAEFSRLQRYFYGRLRANLSSELSGLLENSKLEKTILGTGCLIDGLWLRKAAGSTITHQEAVDLVVNYVVRSAGLTIVKKLRISKPTFDQAAKQR